MPNAKDASANLPLRGEIEKALSESEAQVGTLTALATVANQVGSGGALAHVSMARLRAAERRQRALGDVAGALNKVDEAMALLREDGYPAPVEEPGLPQDEQEKARGELERLRKALGMVEQGLHR